MDVKKMVIICKKKKKNGHKLNPKVILHISVNCECQHQECIACLLKSACNFPVLYISHSPGTSNTLTLTKSPQQGKKWIVL